MDSVQINSLHLGQHKRSLTLSLNSAKTQEKHELFL